MQAPDLPTVISLDRLRSGHHHWQGGVQTDAMGRLHELTETATNAYADFSIDTTGTRAVVQGRCQADVSMICERCLQPMSLAVSGEYALSVVDRMEEADALDPDQAVVVAPRGDLNVVTMIEDELILSLPVVAKHEAGECSDMPMSFGPPGAETAVEKENPFDVLAGLKTTPPNDVE